MALFVLAVNKGLCATFRTILIVVALIDKESVYTQLLKGHCIILFGLVVELIELLLDRFLCAFQLFYGEVISTVLFQFRNALRNFIKLLFEDRPLPFNGHRYFLELRMPDNDGIIVTGGDSTAKAPAVFCFKVFLRGNQDISGWVELQELCRPLLRQMVGDDK